jgi:transposase-like protein
MKLNKCPKCQHNVTIKSGIVKGRQRYQCKNCKYFFTVMKDGKQIDPYYVIKALQLYIEGVSLREIERLIGVSHVSVMNWVKKYKIQAPENTDYHPTYKVLKHSELLQFLSDREQIKDAGMIITELGDKYMLIKWEKFKK